MVALDVYDPKQNNVQASHEFESTDDTLPQSEVP